MFTTGHWSVAALVIALSFVIPASIDGPRPVPARGPAIVIPFLPWVEAPAARPSSPAALGDPEGKPDDGLESVDVAIREPGSRVYLRGFRNGVCEHKFFDAFLGYSSWYTVPGENPAVVGANGPLESVEAIAFPGGALLYMRAFENGEVEQNLFSPSTGWSGWNRLPHAPGGSDAPLPDGDVVDGCDVTVLGRGASSVRVFVRAWRSGVIEQCTYSPQGGLTRWAEIPLPAGVLDAIQDLDDVIESVQIAASGGYYDPRIFTVGLRESRRVYQNIYTPDAGYSGWIQLHGAEAAPELGDDDRLESVDIVRLADDVVLYLQGTASGVVRQKVYVPQTGYTDWLRLTIPTDAEGRTLESVVVLPLEDDLGGARLFVRGFRDGGVQQSFRSPQDGQSVWDDVP